MYIKSTNSLECKSRYVKYRNVLNIFKQLRKKEYFPNKITSFKGDLKWLWKAFNGYIDGKNDKNDKVKSLNLN